MKHSNRKTCHDVIKHVSVDEARQRGKATYGEVMCDKAR